MSKKILGMLLISTFAVTACGSDDGGSEASAGTASTTTGMTTTTGDATTGDATTGDATTGDATTGDESTTTTGTTFIMGGDAASVSTCDPWAQDCPDGEKCVAYASPGASTWDANKCVAVAENPKAPGDTCMETGAGQSGEDDCDETSVCNYLQDGTGICVAFCTGSATAPSCADPDTSCNIDNDGSRILCNPTCNPITRQCPNPERQTCLVANGTDSFNCELGWGDGGLDVGETCVFDNSCKVGSLCWYDPTALDGCTGDACCTPYCDTTDTSGDACAGLGGETECVPFYEGDDAPPGLDNIGVCLIPA